MSVRDVLGLGGPVGRVIALLEIDWKRAVWAVFLGFLSLGSAVGLAAVSAWLIARASQMPPVLQLSVAVVAVRAFGISRGVFRYVERLASHQVALRGMSALRANLYQRLASGRVEASMGLRRGELLSRVGADVDSVGDLVVRAWLPAAMTALTSVAAVVLVTAILPAAGLALLVGLLIGGGVGPWLSARAASLNERRGAQARSDMTATCLEVLENVGPLRVGGGLSGQLAALREADERLAKATDAGAHSAGLAASLSMVGLGISVLSSLVVGIPAVEAGTLAPVLLAVTVLVPLATFELLNVLPAAAVQLHRSREAALRIAELLDASEKGVSTEDLSRTAAGPACGSPADAAEPHSGASVTAERSGDAPGHPPEGASSAGTNEDAPRAGSRDAACGIAISPRDEAGVALEVPPALPALLAADQLACGWPGRVIAVEGVSLVAGPGRSVAIVGPSGVGKTTLLMTLAGLLPSRAGTLRIGGRLRRPEEPIPVDQAQFLAEDAHLFATTVLENLRVARGGTTRDEAVEALEQVGLGSWLRTLPRGLDTRLGQDGSSISGGERRRLLLARASLADVPLLLVDEPAEHLDPESADAVVRWLDGRARGVGGGPKRGLIIATHRLSALERMDEVVMLGPGDGRTGGAARIVARGTHAELLGASADYRWALSQERVDRSLIRASEGGDHAR